MDPAQWTTKDSRAGRVDLLLREKAMKAHLEARQRKDILKDLSPRLKSYQSAFVPGDVVWYWDKDPSKLRDGVWIRAKVLGAENPPMIDIDLKGVPTRVNMAKIRHNPDP